MKLCNATNLKTRTGKHRSGVCTRPVGHTGPHANKTCGGCGVKFTLSNSYPNVFARKSGSCKSCSREIDRKYHGSKPANLQIPKQKHTFPCGCSGILPTKRHSNKLAAWCVNVWTCRVRGILSNSRRAAKENKHAAIKYNTPHSFIRNLMNKQRCVRCKMPLKWEIKRGKTPHLHHNHTTGEIYGFTHSHCNVSATAEYIRSMEKEIARLRKLLSALRSSTRSRD